MPQRNAMDNIEALYTTYRFWVELSGITEAAFTECSGLQSEIEVFDWQEGGVNEYVHRLTARAKPFPNLVLKRGLASDELWHWYHDTLRGRTIRRQNLSILLHGYNGMKMVQWDVTDALPVKWLGPQFKSDGKEVAVETIELIHHGVTRAQ